MLHDEHVLFDKTYPVKHSLHVVEEQVLQNFIEHFEHKVPF